MKASELIELLQKAVAEHGDLRVVVEMDFLADCDEPKLMAKLPWHCEWQASDADHDGFDPPLIVI